MEVKLVFLYFILILIIGGISYKKIKNYEDFFIAGRQGSSLQIAGSLLATILGSSAIIGSVDFAYNVGWAGSWLMLSAAIGLILLYPTGRSFISIKSQSDGKLGLRVKVFL